MDDIALLVNKYGFPIVMAIGLGYIIQYVWKWATEEVKPVISEAMDEADHLAKFPKEEEAKETKPKGK